MHTGASLVGEASLLDPEISPTTPMIFTAEEKCEILPHFSYQSNLNNNRFEKQ